MAESVLVGRQSSHFTRVVRIVAAELGVPLRLQPIFDLMSLDAADYGGNPALKLPVLLRGGDAVYGCLNICRVLAAGSGRGELLVFPEHGLDPLHLDAGELVFNAMGVHTEIVFHEVVSKRPPDAASLKRRAGLLGSLAWLDANLDGVLGRLPPRRTSVFEVALYCLLEHIPFRNPMDLSGFARLAEFVREFGLRPSALATPYRFDQAPTPDAPDAEAVGTLAAGLDEALRELRNGGELAADPRFAALVDRLATGDPARRRDWMLSGSTALACASLAAMRRAGDANQVEVGRVLDRVGYFAFPFALEHLAGSDEPRVLALFLLRLPGWAAEYPGLRSDIWRYLEGRSAAGVAPALDAADAALDWSLEDRRNALADFDAPMVSSFLAGLEARDAARTVASRNADFAHCPAVNARLDRVVAHLLADGESSLLLVGEPGTGKTALLRTALRSLAADGWTVVEASPRDLLASLQHVHPIEERVESLVAGLGGARHVWHALRWYELLDDPGDGSPLLLERLWPWLQQGRLRIVGSGSGYTHARAVQDIPAFASAVTVLELDSLGEADALALARDWALRQSNRMGTDVIAAGALDEALALARRVAPRGAEPGRSLGLLQAALEAAAPSGLPLSREALVAALAVRSGVPVDRVDQA